MERRPWKMSVPTKNDSDDDDDGDVSEKKNSASGHMMCRIPFVVCILYTVLHD